MFIYLHGFSSGPGSTKAKYIRSQFAQIGIDLQVPDLNQDDFTHLTVSRQMAQVVDVLLAPAFDFLAHWLPKIGETQLNSWQKTGYLSIYHHAIKDLSPLHYDFLVDADKYPLHEIDRVLPTLIIHGINDDVIPISASQNFVKDRPWVELLEWDSDHQLTNLNQQIWEEICRFCDISI